MQFLDQSTVPTIDTRQWDFGDSTGGTQLDPIHMYPQPGDYTTVLTVTWSGQTYRTAQTIHVSDPLNVQFTATPVAGTALLTVTFTDQSTALAGVIHFWTWAFGDGVTSTVQNPVHPYTHTGIYDVQLTVRTDTYTKTLRKPAYIFVSPPHQTVINYTYDGLYRLTKADSMGALTSTFEYAYDAVGNRTVQTRTLGTTEVISYVYDEANRLINVGAVTYVWDDKGNLTSDGTMNYAYDQSNRLISTTLDATRTEFTYNGDGVRLREMKYLLDENGVPTLSRTILYAQDVAASLPVVLQATRTSNGRAFATSYHYALGTRPLAQYTNGVQEYLLPDALGSVRQIVDSSGNVTLAESYEPYGSVLSSNGTASSIFGYAGEQIDTSGLVFLRARYMQPRLGIFLARDPWSGEAMRPGSMNGFGYGLGNPIRFVDPSGRSAFSVPSPVAPSARRMVMERFKEYILAFPGNGEGFFDVTWQTLDAEINFVDGMVDSGRLSDRMPDNWWSQADGYLAMSRVPAADVNDFIRLIYPCFKYSDLYWDWGGPFGGAGEAGDAWNFLNGMGLEPGVKEWVYLVWFMNYAKESPSEVSTYDHYYSRGLFWLAHNAALREGVDRAMPARQEETYWEQVLTNYVLYDVLVPGDRCAYNGGGCIQINQAFLRFGLSYYPWYYPADFWAIQKVKKVFNTNVLGIYWLWGIPPPSPSLEGADRYRLVDPVGTPPEGIPWTP